MQQISVQEVNKKTDSLSLFDKEDPFDVTSNKEIDSFVSHK